MLGGKMFTWLKCFATMQMILLFMKYMIVTFNNLEDEPPTTTPPLNYERIKHTAWEKAYKRKKMPA